MKISVAYLFLTLWIIVACENRHVINNSESSDNGLSFLNIEIVDLTYSFSDETIYWVTATQFELDTVFQGYTDKGYYYAANDFSAAEHGGTHIDAPIHFADNGQYVDEIPLENLMGEAIKIDVTKNAKDNPDYLVSIEDFKQ
jgi:kynurenine formamidase